MSPNDVGRRWSWEDVACIALDHGGTLTYGPAHTATGPVAAAPRRSVVDPLAAAAVRVLHRRGKRLVLASNTALTDPPRRLALTQAGIAECFADLVLSLELGHAKPHAIFYRAVLAAAGCDPHRVLFVGNRLVNDVLGPLAHGMRAAIVDSNGEAAGALDHVPVLDHLADLPALLDAAEGKASPCES